MSFFDCIKENFTSDGALGFCEFRILWLGDNGVFLENICHIKSYTNEEIVLQLKKCEILIKGSGLYIKKFCNGDMVVCGKIGLIQKT